MKIPTSYFYFDNTLEEKFHGLYKAYNIKSRLNYNRVLEGRQSQIIKTMFLTYILHFLIN